MNGSEIFYGLGIIGTFALGVWNLIANYKATRRTGFINTVTNQRVQWIEQLRQDISTFSGLTHTWCGAFAQNKREILKEIDRLRYVIPLRLNPEGEHDKKITELILKIPDLTDISRREDLKCALKDLIIHTQFLLKEEWEKVKSEAKNGDLKK